MNTHTFINQIRNLDIPSRCKAELSLLCLRSKKIGLRILRFIKSHQQFTEAMLLGAIAAFLLSKVPLVGGFLSLCALVTAAAMGLLRELRESLTRFFDLDFA